MMWQSGLPRVATMPASPWSVTPRNRCGWLAARTASMAIWMPPSVPFLKPPRVFEGRRRIVHRARPDDHQQPIVLAGEDADDLPARAGHHLRAGFAERQFLGEDRRRQERPIALDMEIAGLHGRSRVFIA